ncbi:hypothetical protein BG000_003423 [Podila horticola]|nr:hypothetical protein BG000_003423 [Podila horticola]
MIESPKPIFSMLGTPDDRLAAEEQHFFLQAHHLRHLVSLNSRDLQKLHFGESSWVFHHSMMFESFYGLLAPLTSLTNFQLPGRGVSLVTLKHILPRLQSVRFTHTGYAVGTLFHGGGQRDSWQLLSDVQYPSLQGRCSNARVLPIKTLEIGKATSFRELCRILKRFPTIERLGIIGIHDYQVPMTEPPQDLAMTHQELFRRNITVLLSHLPNLYALTIPVCLENNIANLLEKSCPYLKTIRTDDYLWHHPPHPETLGSAALLLTSYADLRMVDLVLNQIHINQLSLDQPWTEERHLSETTGQRTAYEDQIVEQMQRSCRQHKFFYWQLSQLSKLRVLHLGFGNPRIIGPVGLWGQIHIAPTTFPNSLERLLASGFDQLQSLKKLEVFGMESLNHLMGKAELKWMVHHWPRLEQMHGLHANKGLRPEHEAAKTKLRKYLHSLKPSIVHVTSL